MKRKIKLKTLSKITRGQLAKILEHHEIVHEKAPVIPEPIIKGDIYVFTKKWGIARIDKLPSNYVLSIKNNFKHLRPEIWEYAEANKELLIHLGEKPITSEVEEPIKCTKLQYHSQAFAKSELKRIRETIGNHKKPIRAYECDICSAWHLTSMEMETYKSTK